MIQKNVILYIGLTMWLNFFFFFHNSLFWPRTLPYIYTILALLTTGKCNKRKESTTNGEYTKTKYENLKIKSKY